MIASSQMGFNVISYLNGYVLFPLIERLAKRDVLTKWRELKRFENSSMEVQKAVQKQELVKMLTYCAEHVPYYKDLFLTHRFDYSLIEKDVRYIEKLPVLTKAIVQEHADRIRSSHAHHTRKTGGSTGQSVFFYYDGEGLDWTSAINLQSYEMATKKPHHTDCHISADLEVLGLVPPTIKGRFLDTTKMFLQNRNRLMISSFSDVDLQEVIKKLYTISPYLLQGHPSTLYALANYIERKGIQHPPKFKIFEPSGEMLTEKIVETVERVFGCKVVNRYGNAEFGVVAHSMHGDSYRRLKVFERAFYVEECKGGALVVTNFTNFGFPLLRYDTGDVGTVVREVSGTFIYDIQGRVHDVVEIDGKIYPTHFIMDALDHKVRHIKEFQILLSDGVVPVLNIVPNSIEDQERIRRLL